MYIGGYRGTVAGVATPLLVGKFYKKGSFFAILGATTPVSGPIDEKNSHERLQPPPLQKFLDPLDDLAYGQEFFLFLTGILE